METLTIYDQDGRERDWDWLVANFGAVHLERAEPTGGAVFRVVGLQDRAGPATQSVHVADRDGRPLEGVCVVRSWSDAPQLPDWAESASRWRKRGVYGRTDEQGRIAFGLGHGDYYFPPAAGAGAIWVASSLGPSDLLTGLGLLGATDHRHLDVVFRLVDVAARAAAPEPGAPQESPSPPSLQSAGDPWQALLEKLDRIIELLEGRKG